MIAPAPARTTRTRGWRTATRSMPSAVQQRHVDAAQPRAGQHELGAGGDVGVGRQHAFAGRDGGERLGLRAAHLHGIERRHRVGVGRQRLAGVDRAAARATAAPARRTTGVERRVGAHRIAVAQRERGRRDGRRAITMSAASVSPSALRERFLARRDRPRSRGRSLPARRRAGSAARSAGFRNPQPCAELDAKRPGCPVSADHGTASRADGGIQGQHARAEMPAAGAQDPQAAVAHGGGRRAGDRVHRSADHDRHSQSACARPATRSRTQRQEGPGADVPDQEELDARSRSPRERLRRVRARLTTSSASWWPARCP